MTETPPDLLPDPSPVMLSDPSSGLLPDPSPVLLFDPSPDLQPGPSPVLLPDPSPVLAAWPISCPVLITCLSCLIYFLSLLPDPPHAMYSKYEKKNTLCWWCLFHLYTLKMHFYKARRQIFNIGLFFWFWIWSRTIFISKFRNKLWRSGIARKDQRSAFLNSIICYTYFELCVECRPLYHGNKNNLKGV